MKKLIVVADWAQDPLASQVIRSTIEGFVTNPDAVQISFVPCSSSTLHTSFLVSQLIQTEQVYGRPMDTVILVGTQPFSAKTEVIEQTVESLFAVARLDSGLYVCGPQAGHNFSLFKNEIETLFIYNTVHSPTQFPARDVHARLVAHLMDSLESELDLEQVPRDTIPACSTHIIGHIDGLGNIITTLTHADIKGKTHIHETVSVSIHDVSLDATYVEKITDVEEGQLALLPSAYGDPGNAFMQLSFCKMYEDGREVTAINAFHHPMPGMKVEVKK